MLPVIIFKSQSLTIYQTETAGAGASPTDAPGAGAISSLPVGKGNNVDSPSATDSPGAVESPGASESPVIIYSTQSVVPLPVVTPPPYSNGTDSSGPGGVTTPTIGGSSGFLSKRKPTPAPSPF